MHYAVYCLACSVAIMLHACTPTGRAPNPTEPPEYRSSAQEVEPTLAPTMESTAVPTAEPTSVPPEHAADVVFHNGTILTMVLDQPRAQAVAVRGQEILAVGSEAEVMAWRGEKTEVVDLEGKTLLPGFVDSHNHIMNDYNSDHFGDTLQERQQVLLENGITTHANLHTSESLLAEFEEFERSGQLVVRMGVFLLYNDSCSNRIGDWYLDHPPTRERGERLRIQGAKVFSAGGNCGFQPAFNEPIAPDIPVPLEPPFVTVEELTSVMVQAQEIGHQVAVHAIGDRAVDVAQTAFANALAGEPNSYRHRIEHNSVVRPDQILRYGEVGAVLTIFADYPSCTPFGEPLSPEYHDWEWPYRRIIEANPDLHVAWSGDAASFTENTLHQLFGFVTRYDVNADGSTCAPLPHLETGTFSVEDALYRMTMESAYALFREDEVGSLEPGKFADLILLSEDPTEVDAFAIKEIQVEMTMIDGHTQYCMAGSEALCP
jgi:predicted amidohydrolase YtcJ